MITMLLNKTDEATASSPLCSKMAIICGSEGELLPAKLCDKAIFKTIWYDKNYHGNCDNRNDMIIVPTSFR